jgi:molybdopterin converting factor small subunit
MATIVYTGALPEVLETGVENIQLPETVTDIQSLLDWLGRRGGPWRRLPRKGAVRATVNNHMVGPGSRVTDRDRVSLVSLAW